MRKPQDQPSSLIYLQISNSITAGLFDVVCWSSHLLKLQLLPHGDAHLQIAPADQLACHAARQWPITKSLATPVQRLMMNQAWYPCPHIIWELPHTQTWLLWCFTLPVSLRHLSQCWVLWTDKRGTEEKTCVDFVCNFWVWRYTAWTFCI